MEIELDRYSELKSRIHGIDPRIKILSLFSFIILIVSTPPAQQAKFILYFFIISSLILASKIPLSFVFKRSLVVLPFVLFISITAPFFTEGEAVASYMGLDVTYEGLLILFNVLVKSYLSALTMILLVSTTPFPRLLKGFEELKVPKVIILTISFMCRYLTLIVDELFRMKRARDCRSPGGNRRWHIRTAGNIIGNLFIRSYERGERVYCAMLSRGFAGNVKTMERSKIGASDLAFMSCVLFPSLMILLV